MSETRRGYGLASPQLEWDENGVPYSLEIGDLYFSKDGGAEETRHVFLDGNNLPGAWQDKSHFVVGELGFGTGLNFLLTADLWKRTRVPGARLWFISIEARPMRSEDITRALAARGQAGEDMARLVALLPEPIRGMHVIHFPNEITLQLCYGEAEEMLGQLSAKIDAWFLDGFSPAKNPAMWNEGVCAAISRLSARGTTLASYSVSSELRRRLEANGFAVEKRPGFGKKREMLAARLDASQAAPRNALCRGAAAIIGGGLAGAATAEAFLRRGWEVTVIERRPGLAAEASGNPTGVLMPHLSLSPDPMSRFYVAGFEFSLRRLEALRRRAAIRGAECGVLRIASSERLAKLQAGLPELGLPASFMQGLGKEEAAALAGFEVAGGGLFFPRGGWVSPPDLCRALAGEGVRHIFSTDIASLRGGPLGAADAVVFCGGYDTDRFPELSWFPLEKVRGQAMSVEASAESSRLAQVVCYDGYVSPAFEGRHFLGATYDHENESTEVSEEQNRDLFSRLHEWVPGLPLRYSGSELSRVSFRTMSRDRIPLCGPVPELAALAEARAPVFRKRWENAALLPGLYANTGHGSRGLISCLLCAELIAAHASGEPLPLELSLLRTLYPARFAVRLLLQGLPLDAATLGSLKVPHLRGT